MRAALASLGGAGATAAVALAPTAAAAVAAVVAAAVAAVVVAADEGGSVDHQAVVVSTRVVACHSLPCSRY